MNITELDNIVRTFQYYADIRSRYLLCAKRCTKDYSFSINVDDDYLCELRSLDDCWFVPYAVQDILFELVFEADSHLHSFCLESKLDYDPVTDPLYLDFLEKKHQI